MRKCNDCPRNCGVDRKTKLGYCGCTDELSIAKIMLHHYEEPIISGTNGSGAIFFGGCNLKCVYCQNGAISTAQTGEVYTREKLISAILDLEEKGAHNINLVTATHYIDQVAQILEVVKPRLSIPVIYNCGGYESVNSLKKLDGLVEVYLPDFKYADNDLAMKYSFARKNKNTSAVMSNFLMLTLIIFAMNMCAVFFTLGAGIIVAISTGNVLCTCFSFVNYCEDNKHKYFLDKNTIIRPETERVLTREEFFRGENK